MSVLSPLVAAEAGVAFLLAYAAADQAVAYGT
jgi:hypothetical protein